MNSFYLLALFFCHFLADYSPLSTPKMLAAKKFGTPIWPIFNHAATHGLLMGFSSFLFGISIGTIMALLWIQILTHWLIDIGKGKFNFYFPITQSPMNKEHWLLFGFDQFLHATVIVYMASIAFS